MMSKLSKLKMPGKKPDPALEIEIEASPEGSDAEEVALEEMPMEEEAGEMEAPSPFADVSDEDLLAEVAKRGLDKQAPSEEESDMPEEFRA